MPDSPIAGRVEIRDVMDTDLSIFFEQQLDPEATAMAAFAARDREAFMAHWARIRANPTGAVRTVVADGEIAGNVVSWQQDGERDVGYWIGKPFWGRGIATRGLTAFLREMTERPLHAHVARHNIASRRVLTKCGFVAEREDGDELVLRLDADTSSDRE
jgi:RimJ/RimL family protein N-acetyltransferase